MAIVSIRVKEGDALAEPADVLVLKYAQALYGVDAAVVGILEAGGRAIRHPQPWEFTLERAAPELPPSQVLFVGVPPLGEFGYGEIRMFARKALNALAGAAPEARHLVLTVHGPGYGLDETEAFEAEVAGLMDALSTGEFPKSLRNITIVERNVGRAARLAAVLSSLPTAGNISTDRDGKSNAEQALNRLKGTGDASVDKAHIFVAMPFREEMDDLYHYGIKNAANTAGFLCERADLSHFTGGVLDWVQTRIRTASLVIAELSDSNPNVYLELGYAWGVGIPTVLVVKDAEQLSFDVAGQRCLTYKKIRELEELLTAELNSLRNGVSRP